METIATNFTRLGFDFEQVRRVGMVAIYRKRSIESGHETLEVIEIKPQAAREAFGKSYPAKEMYPGDAAWGRQGWTCTTHERANLRFDALITAQKLQQSNKTTLQSELGDISTIPPRSRPETP